MCLLWKYVAHILKDLQAISRKTSDLNSLLHFNDVLSKCWLFSSTKKCYFSMRYFHNSLVVSRHFRHYICYRPCDDLDLLGFTEQGLYYSSLRDALIYQLNLFSTTNWMPYTTRFTSFDNLILACCTFSFFFLSFFSWERE